MSREEEFMMEAIRLSEAGIRKNHGGPFGCIIVRGNEIIGRGWNRVIKTNDPTAHAEIVAIRNACKKIQNFHLHNCELYASCEPCPMCLSAIYWAQIKIIYFANTKFDAASVGFNDSFIYDEFKLKAEEREIKMIALGRNDALKIFENWKEKPNKTLY